MKSLKQQGDTLKNVSTEAIITELINRGYTNIQAVSSTKINRVEVIDRTKGVESGGGRVYTNYDVNDAWVSIQDDGGTLKVFINESIE